MLVVQVRVESWMTRSAPFYITKSSANNKKPLKVDWFTKESLNFSKHTKFVILSFGKTPDDWLSETTAMRICE